MITAIHPVMIKFPIFMKPNFIKKLILSAQLFETFSYIFIVSSFKKYVYFYCINDNSTITSDVVKKVK